MAATTPANRRAKRKAVDSSNPGEFDFDRFAQGFRRPVYTAHIFRRADLVPRLTELSNGIDELQGRLERIEEDEEGKDRGIEEDSPGLRLRVRVTELITEFNTLAAEYDASKITITLRSPDGRLDHETIRELMIHDGVFQEEPPDIGTREGQMYGDMVALYSISVICTSHDFDPEQWRKFRDAMGEVSWATIVGAYFEAVKGILPSAPFSLRDLPTRTPEES